MKFSRNRISPTNSLTSGVDTVDVPPTIQYVNSATMAAKTAYAHSCIHWATDHKRSAWATNMHCCPIRARRESVCAFQARFHQLLNLFTLTKVCLIICKDLFDFLNEPQAVAFNYTVQSFAGGTKPNSSTE